MYCPRCGSEYRDGYVRCEDCDLDLVAAEPDPRLGHEAAESALLVETTDLSLIAVLKSLLAGAEIPFTLRGEGLMNLFPSEALSPRIDPRKGDGVQILVPAHRVDEARELLREQLTEGEELTAEDEESGDEPLD